MKRISSLIIALLIVLSTVFSLSSCLMGLSDILNPTNDSGRENDKSDQDDKNDVSNGDSDNTNPGNDNSTGSPGTNNNGSNAVVDDEDSVYYPVDGEASITSPAKALLSIVSVLCTFETSYGQSNPVAGSGVIYKLDKDAGDAYVITNYHVVYNRHSSSKGGISEDINLYLYGMELEDYAIKAEYIGGSLTQDLAVLKIENSDVLKNSYAREADFGDSNAISPLDSVIVIGNPEGLGISVTTGIISVDSETLEMVGADGQTTISLRVIRVDAAINEGNSGGGLFDDKGNLIGIVNAKRTGSDVDNIAYAIPFSYAENFVENIIFYCDGEENRTPYKCLLGVTVTNAVAGIIPDADSGTITKAEYFEVAELSSDSVLIGKLEVGDRLLSVTVDGVKKDITRIHHLIDHVLTARVGSTVTIEAMRDGEEFSITVTVPDSALTSVR